MSTLTLLERAQCPLGEHYRTESAGRWSYQSPFLASHAKLKLPEKIMYEILVAPEVDFYWQRWVLVGGDVDATPLAQVPPPKLEQLAHYAEEALFLRLMIKNDRPKVYDVGMGTGGWLKQMKGWGMEAHGSDPWPAAKEAAAQHGLVYAPLESYPDEFFDAINATEVFEHLNEPMQMATLVAKKLKKGGIFSISTPGDKKMRHKLINLSKGKYMNAEAFEKNFRPLWPLAHVNLFSRRSLHAMARQAGLKPLKAPLIKFFQASVGPFSLKQLNRMIYNPLKRHKAAGTQQYFVKATE